MNRSADERMMAECLRLARKGSGNVSPNPLVGAVVVLNGKVIGKGYHAKFGGPHAEVNAIRNALRSRSSIHGATMYVNLEPCSHHGKTPPCADAIVAHGIAKVVCAMKDPNPLVAGGGFRFLRNHGVRIVVGVMADQAERLNEKFSKFITTGLPFVALKVAQTSDGFVARTDGTSRWITTKRSRSLVHALRSQYDGVLVGAGTVIADNPRLNVRYVAGRDPRRVVLDGKLRASLSAHVFNDRGRSRTILISDRKQERKSRKFEKKGVEVVLMRGRNGEINVNKILRHLGRRGIASLLVEGGSATYRLFLKAGAVDKVYLFTSRKKFGSGLPSFAAPVRPFVLRDKKKIHLGGDTLVEGRVEFRARG